MQESWDQNTQGKQGHTFVLGFFFHCSGSDVSSVYLCVILHRALFLLSKGMVSIDMFLFKKKHFYRILLVLSITVCICLSAVTSDGAEA